MRTEVAAWSYFNSLIHWRRVTHICVSNLTIIGSDNSLSPGRRQAIIWTPVGISWLDSLEQIQRHFDKISIISIQENADKWVECKQLQFVSAWKG